MPEMAGVGIIIHAVFIISFLRHHSGRRVLWKLLGIPTQGPEEVRCYNKCFLTISFLVISVSNSGTIHNHVSCIYKGLKQS